MVNGRSRSLSKGTIAPDSAEIMFPTSYVIRFPSPLLSVTTDPPPGMNDREKPRDSWLAWSLHPGPREVLPKYPATRTGGVMTRNKRRKKPAAQRGFSMMQLIVTLAVVSVVSGLAV